MLAALADPILPIFAVLVIGFVLSKRQILEPAHGAAINRYVFFVGGPSLVFSLVARANIEQVDWPVLGSYALAEGLVMGSIFTIARLGFKRGMGESILLGMAAGFVNHIFFVLPILESSGFANAAQGVTNVLLVDSIVFCLMVFLVDAFGSGQANPAKAIRSLATSPFFLAPVVGIIAWFIPDFIPSGLFTFADFAGLAAAPVSLFALGIVLGGQTFTRFGPMLWIVVGTKLVIHPTIAFFGFEGFGIDETRALVPFLVAAGPCGAMPFVIATQFGVNTDTIAKAVLISTTLSVLTLSVLI